MSELFKKDQLNSMSVQELLDLEFSQIAIVEGFKPLPTAMYRLSLESCALETVGENEIPALQLKVKVYEAVAFENKADEVTFIESGTAERFPYDYQETYYLQRTNKDTQAVESAGGTVQAFRTAFDSVATAVGLNSATAVMEWINANPGTMAQAVIKHRKYKNKETGEMRESNQIDVVAGINLL